jgi:hypothetical protein
VSNWSPEVSQEIYTWKATNVGSNRLDIHPEDDSFIPGDYYIGILAYRPGLNTFRIRVDYQDTPEYTMLQQSVQHSATITDDACAYFRVRVENAGETRLHVVVTPGYHKVALFASPSILYPSIEEH